MDDIRYKNNTDISVYILDKIQDIFISTPFKKKVKLLGKKKAKERHITSKQEIDALIEKDNVNKKILNYIKDNHPYTLICDLSKKFNWPSPEVVTKMTQFGPPPVFKSTISVNNKKVTGESEGSTKRKAKEYASINVLVNMLKDNYLKESIRLLINSVTKNKDYPIEKDIPQLDVKPKFKNGSHNKEESFQIDSSTKAVLKTKGETLVSHTLCANSTKDSKIINPNLSDASSSKESQVDDENQNIKHMLSARRFNRALSNYDISEVQDIKTQLLKVDKLFEDLNKHNDRLHIQRRFEIFCLKHERSSFTSEDFIEKENFLSHLPSTNEGICSFFDGPTLIGSYLSNCNYNKTKTVDIVFMHELEKVTVPFEILLKNLRQIFLKDTEVDKEDTSYHSQADILNKFDDLNFDAELKMNDFSLNLIIRNKHFEDIDYLDYTRLHFENLPSHLREDKSFTILRRLIRLWRRKFKLFCIPPEILDWILCAFKELAISETFAKVMYKISKRGKNIFKAGEFKDLNIPQVILRKFESLNEDDMDSLISSCKGSLDLISKMEFDSLFL